MAEAFAQTLAPKIEEILTGSNLESVSAKAVRKNLINQGIDESYIKNYKSQIDEVIKGIYMRLSAAAESQAAGPDHALFGYNGAFTSGGTVKREGGGAVKRETPSASQGSESKRAKSSAKSKVKSSGTVGSDDEATVVKKKAKPRKRKKAEGETSEPSPNNPFNKPLQLSPEFADVLGESQVSRPQAVKLLWVYIKEHNLQDPEDKRYIICDEKLMRVLGEPRVHMMTMNKLLSSHFSPLPVPENDPSINTTTPIPSTNNSNLLPPPLPAPVPDVFQ
ncbi:hypothetical protein QFC22_001420 [Naganishia vaughanmartiniae]|uniref:Uncharacterized protein n=1 Tax=Naganishia vaughanmartiniae TaxID=1424756 RepID=A0ACC2XIK2_9TREE|nr:hypothetical protein QFC22_001420 [Naganishia vaughanmartiniae]